MHTSCVYEVKVWFGVNAAFGFSDHQRTQEHYLKGLDLLSHMNNHCSHLMPDLFGIQTPTCCLLCRQFMVQLDEAQGSSLVPSLG